MNRIVKMVLMAAKEAALDAASSAVPGAGILIGGVEKLIDKDNDNNSEAITELVTGLTTAVTSLDSKHIKDQSKVAHAVELFQQGAAELKAGLQK